MSHIPKVRLWRVQYWKEDLVFAEVTINTINKRFARWIARDYVGWTKANSADRITVSIVRGVK